MVFHNRFRAVSLLGLAAAMVVGANGATISYSTDSIGTGFSGGSSLVLNSTSGAAASLTFSPRIVIDTGVPSFVNLGVFDLLCAACSTQTGGVSAVFSPFTFDLTIVDLTNGGVGTFVGTATGGPVFSNVSNIQINWSPLQLGPGMNNASSGSFGPASFTTTNPTNIVAPNSGLVPGRTSVQGFVDSQVPEPSAILLLGTALLGLGFIRRKIA